MGLPKEKLEPRKGYILGPALFEIAQKGPYKKQLVDIADTYIKKLSKKFDVSRSTIRKAMSILSARGLVVQKHGVGTFVSNISKINNLYSQQL